MVEHARRRYPRARSPSADPLAGGMDATWDWAWRAGSSTCATKDSYGRWSGALRRARRGAALNMLSTWSPVQEPAQYYADPAVVLDFCGTLTSRVVLRHDYLPHDFTVYLYREA